MSVAEKIDSHPPEKKAIITLSESAIAKVQEFHRADPENKDKLFRVYVEGGGCGGFQYGFIFDEERDGDNVVDCGEVKVLVDAKSRLYISGSEVNYKNDMMESGFEVTNPQAKGGCGCGKSFNV
jgi:iron-sulfur cluster insertion protein